MSLETGKYFQVCGSCSTRSDTGLWAADLAPPAGRPHVTSDRRARLALTHRACRLGS